MSETVDILAIGVHPDDVELSASGTLMKQIEQGSSVAIVDLTRGELGSRGSAALRIEEAGRAADIMGISHRVNLGMEDGFFEANTENKRRIIEQIRRFRPKVVLANAIHDRHPDHGRAAKLTSDACFLAGLRKIETSWDGKPQEHHRPEAVYHYIQDYYLEPDFVVDVTDYVDRKIEVIKAFSSQFYDPLSKEPATPISGEDFFDFIKSRMRNFGRPAGVPFAEGFTRSRYLRVDDLFDLK